MKKSNGQLAVTPYELIAQTSRNSEVINPSVNNPLAPEHEVDIIHFQEQPEQQAQAHDESEGQRRALQLIEDYATDISEDEYEFEDDISIQQQPRQSAQATGEPWEQKQDEQQGDEEEEDDLIIHPQPGSDEAREQHQPQQQAQAQDRRADKRQIQPNDLPDNDDEDEDDEDDDEDIKLQQQPEQQAQALPGKDEIKARWQQQVGAAKVSWGKLTDDELLQTEGHAQKLTGLVQERYAISRDEAEKQVKKFFKDHN